MSVWLMGKAETGHEVCCGFKWVMVVPSGEEKWSARLKTTFGGAAQSRAGDRPMRNHNTPNMDRGRIFTVISLRLAEVCRLYLTGSLKVVQSEGKRKPMRKGQFWIFSQIRSLAWKLQDDGSH